MTRIVTHPGRVLQEEYLAPYGMSATALALALYVPPDRITESLNGRGGVSAETAMRVSRYFGTTPDFWLNLQSNHDLSVAQAGSGP